nr:hypothetical protein HK105_007803 [Polyrhizophydium stewartii]
MVFSALETYDVGKSEKAVRINSVGSGLELDDLNVVLRSRNLQALLIPKVNSPRDIHFVAHMIDSIAPSIDLVCVDFQSPEILEQECTEGRQFGFTGKQAIHPKQIAAIHRVFAPSTQDVERASRIVGGYEEHLRKGVGAFNLDGKMIDMPVVKWAQRLLAKAESIAEIDKAAGPASP